MSGALPGVDTRPMEARLVDALPAGEGWQFEPKWDGFRCLAFKAGGGVELRGRSGKSLSRFFPEMVAALQRSAADGFVLDGELVLPQGDTLSFDALQARLHPAESRIRKLATETPARLMLFDCLGEPATGSLLAAPLSRRRDALAALVPALDAAWVRLSPGTTDRDEAGRWLGRSDGTVDGVVAKRLDGPYRPGERTMLKIKRLRTADCVVGGFRYATGRPVVGSLLLGLYDDQGLLDHVGFTAALADADRPSLTARLQALAGPPGFTGRAPGAPSRWSTDRSATWVPLRPELVVEVQYDQVTGQRFRHGTRLLRWRLDKTAAECRLIQLDLPVDST